MLELKKDTQVWVPVRMIDASNNPIPGLTDADVTCSVLKSDGTEASQSISGATWAEATSGTFADSGTYRIQLSASSVDVSGALVYVVADTSTPPNLFVGVADVVDNFASDTYALMVRAIGLMHENSVLDTTVYSGSRLTSGRLRLYDSKANAQAAGLTGLVATYTITATYSGNNVATYTVVLEP